MGGPDREGAHPKARLDLRIPVQRLSVQDVTVLTNPGKRSEQLVWHRNAPDASVTITRVTMQPGAVSTRHKHARSEQIWLVERGAGTLLLEGEAQVELRAGDVVRTPAGETHGVINTGKEPLIYLAITAPPEDFTERYEREEPQSP
jgi:mannose-6-phosphate isomerase-like protein (cupin superfamily)